jgi:hypothetical protein
VFFSCWWSHSPTIHRFSSFLAGSVYRRLRKVTKTKMCFDAVACELPAF